VLDVAVSGVVANHVDEGVVLGGSGLIVSCDDLRSLTTVVDLREITGWRDKCIGGLEGWELSVCCSDGLLELSEPGA
jgi:hypothetical protein